MKNPFQKPKEFVMSAITMMVMSTFCYLAIIGTVSPEALEKVLMFIVGGYVGGKFALSGNNGNGVKTPNDL